MQNDEQLGRMRLMPREKQSNQKSDNNFLREVVVRLSEQIYSNMALLRVPVRVSEIKDPRNIMISFENYSPNTTMVLYSFPRGIQNAQNCSTYSSPPPDLSQGGNLGLLGNPLRNIFINDAIGTNVNLFLQFLQDGVRISGLEDAKKLFEAAFGLVNYDMRSCTNVFFNVRPRLYSKEALRELFIAIERGYELPVQVVFECRKGGGFVNYDSGDRRSASKGISHAVSVIGFDEQRNVVKLYNSGYERQPLGLSEMPFDEFIGLLRAGSRVNIENGIVNPSFFSDKFDLAIELEKENKVTVVKSEKESKVSEAFLIYQYDSNSQPITPKWLVEIPLGNKSTLIADLAFVGKSTSLDNNLEPSLIFNRFVHTEILPIFGFTYSDKRVAGSLMFSGKPNNGKLGLNLTADLSGSTKVNIFHNQTHSLTKRDSVSTTGGSLKVDAGNIKLSIEYLNLKEKKGLVGVKPKEPSSEEEIKKYSQWVLLGIGPFTEYVDLGQKYGKEVLVVKVHWSIKDDQDMFFAFNFGRSREEKSLYRGEGYKALVWDPLTNEKAEVIVISSGHYSSSKTENRDSGIFVTYRITFGNDKNQEVKIFYGQDNSNSKSFGVTYTRTY